MQAQVQCRSAWELREAQGQAQRLSFGCAVIDQATRGGVRVGGITEIAGEAGAGKTQTALCLALQAQLPVEQGGLGGKTAYLCCGEGDFPIRRYAQLAAVWEKKSGIAQNTFLDGILIENMRSVDDECTVLDRQLPTLIQSQNVKLVVFDSMAGLVRLEYGHSMQDLRGRTQLLIRLGQKMKRIASNYQVAFVVTNQVSARESTLEFETGKKGQSQSSPALGLAWANCVNHRILLTRDSLAVRTVAVDSENVPPGDMETTHASKRALIQSKRYLVVVFSPCIPATRIQFSITSSGLRGVPEDMGAAAVGVGAAAEEDGAFDRREVLGSPVGLSSRQNLSNIQRTPTTPALASLFDDATPAHL